MLRYTTLGGKILLGLFGLLAAAALYLPFLEAFALTPAIAFIHRFSITLNIGSDTKTLQPIVFIVPILLIKGLFEYHKRFDIKTLLNSVLTKVILLIVSVDAISILTSTSRSASIGTFLVHGLNLAVFITSSLWLALVIDMLGKENLRKLGISLAKTFIIALTIFSVVNTVASVSQIADCSLANTGCHIWAYIDQAFPNKLLLVGHQKFSYKPVIIRAPGMFGDVNFNGMFSLLVVTIAGVLLAFTLLLKTDKGYNPKQEQHLLAVLLVSGIISFALTLSRSALLGMGLTGIVLFVVFLAPIIKAVGISAETKKIVGRSVGISILLIALLFGIGALVPISYKGRQTTVTKEVYTYVKDMFNPQEDSAQGHAGLFASAITIGNQRPLVGMGLGTFSLQYDKVIEPGVTTANPHSTYGLLYAEQGIVGLLGYLVAIGICWFTAIKAGTKLTKEILTIVTQNKKLTRDFYLHYGARLLLTLVFFGVPFFSVATISYYGFFLPMAWWWGNAALL